VQTSRCLKLNLQGIIGQSIGVYKSNTFYEYFHVKFLSIFRASIGLATSVKEESPLNILPRHKLGFDSKWKL
jgi:hypothetical protein